MKVLLYCNKAKPYLVRLDDYATEHYNNNNRYMITNKQDVKELSWPILNGKVVASFEVNLIEQIEWNCFDIANTFSLSNTNLLSKSCLTNQELCDYVGDKESYAWHFDNLRVFDEPVELKELNYIVGMPKFPMTIEVTKAPQSYMYVYYKGEKYLLLSVKVQYVYDIIEERKTVEIRKSKPKEVER